MLRKLQKRNYKLSQEQFMKGMEKQDKIFEKQRMRQTQEERELIHFQKDAEKFKDTRDIKKMTHKYGFYANEDQERFTEYSILFSDTKAFKRIEDLIQESLFSYGLLNLSDKMINSKINQLEEEELFEGFEHYAALKNKLIENAKIKKERELKMNNSYHDKLGLSTLQSNLESLEIHSYLGRESFNLFDYLQKHKINLLNDVRNVRLMDLLNELTDLVCSGKESYAKDEMEMITYKLNQVIQIFENSNEEFEKKLEKEIEEKNNLENYLNKFSIDNHFDFLKAPDVLGNSEDINTDNDARFSEDEEDEYDENEDQSDPDFIENIFESKNSKIVTKNRSQKSLYLKSLKNSMGSDNNDKLKNKSNKSTRFMIKMIVNAYNSEQLTDEYNNNLISKESLMLFLDKLSKSSNISEVLIGNYLKKCIRLNKDMLDSIITNLNKNISSFIKDYDFNMENIFKNLFEPELNFNCTEFKKFDNQSKQFPKYKDLYNDYENRIFKNLKEAKKGEYKDFFNLEEQDPGYIEKVNKKWKLQRDPNKNCSVYPLFEKLKYELNINPEDYGILHLINLIDTYYNNNPLDEYISESKNTEHTLLNLSNKFKNINVNKREYDHLLLDQKKFQFEEYSKEFLNSFMKYINFLDTHDQDDLPLCVDNLLYEIRERIDNIQSDFSENPYEDLLNYDKSELTKEHQFKVEVKEIMHFQGVSLSRFNNLPPEDLVLVKNEYEKGFLSYTLNQYYSDKFNELNELFKKTNIEEELQKLDTSKNYNFENDTVDDASLKIVEEYIKKNLTLGGESKSNILDKMLLFEECFNKIKHFEYMEKTFFIRVYVEISVPMKNKETGVIENSHHLCLFESSFGLFEPEARYKSKKTIDMFKYGKIGKWFLADVDGIMNGNPPTSNFAKEFKKKRNVFINNPLIDPYSKLENFDINSEYKSKQIQYKPGTDHKNFIEQLNDIDIGSLKAEDLMNESNK